MFFESVVDMVFHVKADSCDVVILEDRSIAKETRRMSPGSWMPRRYQARLSSNEGFFPSLLPDRAGIGDKGLVSLGMHLAFPGDWVCTAMCSEDGVIFRGRLGERRMSSLVVDY